MLDPVCTETMLIKTFGSENCSTQLCEAVELEVSQQPKASLEFLALLIWREICAVLMYLAASKWAASGSGTMHDHQ